MTTQSTTGLTNSSVNLGQYFNSQITPTQSPQTPGFFSRMWSGTQHFVYAPVRNASEEAVQGLANRLSEIFTANQEEITRRIRNVFTQAFVGRSPESYYRMQVHFTALLNNPTRYDLDQVKLLLERLNTTEIRNLIPNINDQGIQALTTLRSLLDTEITEQPSTEVGASPVLTVSQTARERLQVAEAIIRQLVENNEGALIQTLNYLTQSLISPEGPIQVLRQQMNHPRHGIISEGLASLRRDLNGRAVQPLRQCKESLENYRSALRRNTNLVDLLPFMQALHEKLQQLLNSRNLVPVLLAEQWVQLEQFDQELQNNLSSANTISPVDQLLAQSTAPNQMLNAAFVAQRGILEEASDIIVEGIGRGVMHLENLPSRMVQNLFSPQPRPLDSLSPGTDQTPVQPTMLASGGNTSEATETAANFLNLNTIAVQGRRFLDSILSSASGALSQQGTRSLATLVRYTFEKIRDHLQQAPEEQRYLLDTINPMIQRLEIAMDQSSWGNLTSVLQETFQFMQQQQVYLQTLRLPLNPVRTNVSAIPEFLQNINTHQNILQPPSQRIPQKVSEAMIWQKASLLKSRTSSLGPAKLVLEKICGIETNDALYAEIYKSSDDAGKDLPSIYRQRIYDKIDQANLGLFDSVIKWSAKRAYDVFLPLSSFYVNSILDGILDQLKIGIKNSSSPKESKEEFFIKLVRNWLAVTSGAYNQVAATPSSQVKDLDVMMEEAIKMPERNGGLKQNELLAATVKTTLEAFGPRIKWTETIDRYFATEIPSHSLIYFLNSVAVGLNYFCRFCLRAIVFVPQWTGNQILQGGAKIAFGNNRFLLNYSNETVESFRRNTPTSYSLQHLLYRQLLKIQELIQRSLNDETFDTGLRSRDTNIKRVEVTSLVEYLLEVLNKSQYRTQDRLNNYLQHHAPLRDQAGREIDDTFMPEAMETIVMTLSLTLKSITQEEDMQQMLYDALCIFNDAFDDKPSASDEDFATIERGIRELTDQILETTMFHAIDEKFDFMNEKQKRGIRNFINTWKEQSLSFSSRMHQLSTEISQEAISPQSLASTISSMIDYSTQYNRDRVDALGKADGNRNFHTETKYHLNELSRQLLTYCNPVSQLLNQMKIISDEISLYDKLLRSFLISFQINQTLEKVLRNQNLSPQDLKFCSALISQLKSHLVILQRNRCPLSITDEIQRLCQESFSSIRRIEELQETEGRMRAIYSLFSQLKSEKLASRRNFPSATLKQLERQLCNLLNSLPASDRYEMNQQVLSLMLAHNVERIETAASNFYSLHFQFSSRNFSEENNKRLSLYQTQNSLHSHLTQNIQEFSRLIASDKLAIQHHCLNVETRISELNRWVQSQHELPIWNLFIFDMQWVTETTKNLAFDRAQTKMRQLFDSFYQRHNYYGFINQALILPFLKKFGHHHLKSTS